jgi:hypothetical protein
MCHRHRLRQEWLSLGVAQMVKDLAISRQSKVAKQSYDLNEFRQKLFIPPTIVQWGHTPTLAGGGFLHVRTHCRTS